MNKKINYLAIIPVFGTVILLFWLFIKMSKHEINKKKFHAYFISCALFGFLSILITILFLNFINSLVDITDFINSYGIFIAFLVGGYLMNLFTFFLFNKYEYKIFDVSKYEKMSFSINKKNILLLGCVLAIIIICIGLILVLMLKNNLL